MRHYGYKPKTRIIRKRSCTIIIKPKRRRGGFRR